ncbi:MAG: LysM peptidoglycan-binding domain-containing protein [Spirochaetaceae bacterium]
MKLKIFTFLFFIQLTVVLFGGTAFKYEVKRYDTIKSLSNKFKVEEDIIITTNDLDTSTFLLIGQELEIPVSYSYFEPITSNLVGILNKRISNWRNPTLELYKWDKKPDVLIFDTINYSFQALMFKRLAFFLEKKDYIGEIYTLEELSDERGWNGHDYSAKDLASFFSKAKLEGYPLTAGEEVLLDVILKNSIIGKTSRGYIGLGGAIISCSRSSYYNHRYTILRHESLHGLYFTSLGFRNHISKIWDALDDQSKEIWTMYMEVLDYDSTDEKLVQNEFMAYLLQASQKETYIYLNDIVYFRLWDYFPDNREFIHSFFRVSSKPYSLAIKGLRSFTENLLIE